MAKKKVKHYDVTAIKEKDALFNLIFGERSNGKSYQMKQEIILPEYFEHHHRFMLVRRNREELTTDKVQEYFADADIEKWTDGKYNGVISWRKKIYLATYDYESGEVKKGDYIGYICVLSQEQNYAGGSFLDVTNIVFEEFMARGSYLYNEPSKLFNLYCTVDRKRGTTKLWLVGNTLSRANPYLVEWELLHDVVRMKQGTILTKKIPVDEEGTDITLAVEYAESTGATSYTFGKHAKMMNNGEWQSDPQPHLPKSKKEYRVIYRMCFLFQQFCFIGEVLQAEDSLIWFIYPKYSPIREGTLVVSDIIRPERNYQTNIYNLDTRNKSLLKFASKFTEANIFFSSDLCGTDFKQVINFNIRR